MTQDLELRADALLSAADVPSEAQWSACVTLADGALLAAGDDREAAKEELRRLLEITGFLPYEPGGRTDFWGVRRKPKKTAEGEGR